MKRRIYWRNFISHHPATYRKIQHALRHDGFHLVLKFDNENVCHDAYIVRLPKSSQRTKE